MNREILILRETVVKLTQLLTGMGLKVTQQGTKAFVKVDSRTQKPELINIPHIPDNAEKDLILAIQGFVDHEVAHVLFTDWKVVAKSNAKGEKFNSLRNLLEDTFIEREMGKKFPGSVYNVKQLHSFFLDKITKPALDAAKGDVAAEFSMLLVPMVRALAGQEIFKDYMKRYWSHPLVKALMDQLPKSAVDKIAKIRSTQDSFDLAQIFFDIIHPPKPPAPPGSGTGDDEDSCNEKGKGDSDSKSKSKPEKEEKPAPKPAPKDEDESEDEDEDEGDEEEEKPAPKPKPEPKSADEDEDEDEGSGDDDGDEDGSDVDGEDDSDGDEEGEDDSSGASSDGDDSDDEEDGESGAGTEGDDDEGDDEGSGSSDGEGDDESDDDAEGDSGDGDSGDVGAKGARSEEDEDNSERPDHTKHKEEDGEGGEGNKKPNPFETTDCAAAREFEDLLSGKIEKDTSVATSTSDYKIFTRDFDRIERLEPSPHYRDAWLTKLDDQTRAMVGLMQKDIERMMAARSQSVKVPGYRSGRLNSAGLHRIFAGDDRVFRRLHEAKSLDTEVGLLIDNSGSMSSYGKIEIAMATGYALSQTLERVGIKHEVIGFTTDEGGSRGFSMSLINAAERRAGIRYSRVEPLYMPIYKDFDERLTPDVKRRFASTAHEARFMRSNIDGECVEIAVQRLAKRPAKRKVLLVLSDGQPAGAGVHHEQIGKLRSAIKEAPKFGVDLIGIGILDASVRGYYPRHVVLGDLNELPKTVMAQLKDILMAA